MSNDVISILIKMLIIICTIATFLLCFCIDGGRRKKSSGDNDKKNKIILFPKAMGQIETGMKKSKNDYFNYDTVQEFLKKNGAVNLGNGYLNPVNFMFFKTLLAIGVFILALFLKFNIWISLVAGMVGFFILDFLIKSNNKSDNEEMLDDINRANQTIRMYGKAGVFLAEAIYQCYRYTENKRLKKAFLEMHSEILLTHDAESALANFNEKFNNDYIDSLTRNLEQIFAQGFSESLLNDMNKDMLEMQRELNFNYKEAMKRKWTLLTMFLLIIALVICVIGMMGDFNMGSLM